MYEKSMNKVEDRNRVFNQRWWKITPCSMYLEGSGYGEDGINSTWSVRRRAAERQEGKDVCGC